MSKATQNARGMLRLLALRVPKSSKGSQFLITGIRPGQSCSCGILQKNEYGSFEILRDMIDPFVRTVEFLGAQAATSEFELNVLELSRSGPALPPKSKRVITQRELANLVASGKIASSTSFIVKPAA